MSAIGRFQTFVIPGLTRDPPSFAEEGKTRQAPGQARGDGIMSPFGRKTTFVIPGLIRDDDERKVGSGRLAAPPFPLALPLQMSHNFT